MQIISGYKVLLAVSQCRASGDQEPKEEDRSSSKGKDRRKGEYGGDNGGGSSGDGGDGGRAAYRRAGVGAGPRFPARQGRGERGKEQLRG